MRKKLYIVISILIFVILGCAYVMTCDNTWDEIRMQRVQSWGVENCELSLSQKRELNQWVWDLELELSTKTDEEIQVLGGEYITVTFIEDKTIYVWAFTSDLVTCEKYECDENGRKTPLWAERYEGNQELFDKVKSYIDDEKE